MATTPNTQVNFTDNSLPLVQGFYAIEVVNAMASFIDKLPVSSINSKMMTGTVRSVSLIIQRILVEFIKKSELSTKRPDLVEFFDSGNIFNAIKEIGEWFFLNLEKKYKKKYENRIWWSRAVWIVGKEGHWMYGCKSKPRETQLLRAITDSFEITSDCSAALNKNGISRLLGIGSLTGLYIELLYTLRKLGDTKIINL